MIIEYKIVSGHDETAVATEINGLLKQGWQLWQGLSSAGNLFAQAMVRSDETPGNVDKTI